ncbi:hypothetical protein LXL04_027674 [Taraxacum kok-saghyz]
MYIGITQRRIGSVKEAGKIKMSVGIIAYYNLMQVCQVNVLFHNWVVNPKPQLTKPQHVHTPLVNKSQMGSGYFPDRHVSSFFGQTVDFQPARDCPRNFIIFDRTDNHRRVMYHPDTALVQKDDNTPGVINEDLADIDALLSFEDEEEEDQYEEDDDVSTGRTGGHDGSDTSDSCSSSMRNGGPGVLSGKDSERKRDKMKKMVKSLKGIVPGVNGGMNTVDVLDEAVKYLKSLKVEAQKMGIGDLQG